MLPSSNCGTPQECQRYHDDLCEFLELEQTIYDLGHKCIAAVKSLQLDLYDKQDKFAGYRRHGTKNCFGAMTTSPAENQVLQTRRTGIDAKHNLDKSLTKAINHC